MEVLPVIPKRFKFAKGATWLFLALSMLLLVYTYYRAEFIYDGKGYEKYFKYYLISLSGILFWGTVLCLKDAIKLKVTMAATSLVVGIYLVEITFHFLDLSIQPNYAEIAAKLARKDGIEFDMRTKLQVVKQLQRDGIDAVPMFLPYLVHETNGIPGSKPLFPLSGIANKYSVSCNENGKYAVNLNDRFGFNNPDSEWDSPKTEWLFVGDSFTYGACVQPGEEIPAQVRIITGENVLNLGMHGSGPLTELAILKEYAKIRQPKQVIWIYYPNDSVDLNEEISVPLLKNYLQEEFSQGLIHRHTEIDNKLKKFIIEATVEYEKKLASGTIFRKKSPYFFLKTKILRLGNIREQIGFDRLRNRSLEYPKEVMNPLFSEILKKARDRVASWGGKLYFVYIPSGNRYLKDVWESDLPWNPSEIMGVAKNLNIPVIDIYQEVFANHPDPFSLYPFRIGTHLNAEGYSKVAKVIVSGVTGEQKSRKTIDEGD
jgi:hypothetical protein